jgi:hypothetical protein
MFFSIEFGMLSGPGALLLPRYLRHMSYVDLSNVFDIDACISPRFSSTNPLRSCQGYCLTAHTHSQLWVGWCWHVGMAGWLSMDCCM